MKSKIWSGALCLTLFVLHASSATRYVNLHNANPLPPYTGWSTAATNIQDAIDASSDGDLVLVSNGVYQTGGRVVYGSLTNRVVIDKAITVKSVNGPAVTMIEGNSELGSNAVRCVFMSTNSVLEGFTVTNGGTLTSGDYGLDECGAGVWTTNNSTAVVSNCVLVGNVADGGGGGEYNGFICNSSIIQNSACSGGGVTCEGIQITLTGCLIANNSAVASGGGGDGVSLINCRVLQNTAAWGGGTYFGQLHGCLVASNTATQMGGGSYIDASVVNCTIVGNSAYQGDGGIGLDNFIYNSIIYYNTALIGSYSNYDGGVCVFVNCCTAPTPPDEINSITNEPGFVDANNGNFHLDSSSPCINGGDNLWVIGDNFPLHSDLDGNPRIVDGLVDIGAYEYQTPGFILPYYWMREYNLPSDGTIDSDGDGMNNWEEAVAGTNPTNAASVLRLSISNSVSGVLVTWPGVADKVYYLQSSTNLLSNPAFVSIYTNSPFPSSTTLGFRDTSATNGGSRYYRLGVLY